ncbi:MAG: AmmeMemoRadiSam system protein B [Candidatus Omnitrophica bacterium]|nr:AmmeMemoRadiSam system protein B [Candidatus Omnitrophota bacterium]
MIKRIIIFLLLPNIVFFADMVTPVALEAQASIRKAAVAGAFYPDNPTQLRKMITQYLKTVPAQHVEGDLKVLISPHAGYIYSGPVAAYGYKLLRGNKFDIVAVLAVSHYYPFQGASVFDGTSYETPLGNIPIDQEAAALLRGASPLIGFHAFAHEREHSLEVQLPFLQVVLEDHFKLIPIVIGDTSYETAQAVAHELAKIAQTKNILVVASTDLSHFEPYRKANQMDEQTVQEIMRMSPQGLQSFFKEKTASACGKCPVVTALMYADLIGAREATVLKYANSGDTAGDKSNVVGYVSIAIIKKGEKNMKRENNDQMISQKSREELFSIVRNSIREQLTTGNVSKIETANPELQLKNGVFVTLHTKQGSLRGCIGNFFSDKPLCTTVQEMALSSAFHDPRFPPVSIKELDNLTVEISVLSPMKKINNENEIELGKHGIYIKKGFRSGTFLPQVATETGWSLDEFLGHCSQDKAGLGWEGWKNAEVFTYTAEVFGEDT